MISTLETVAGALDPEAERGGGRREEEMGARSWSAGGPSPTQTAQTPACLQSSVYPSPPTMTVQQQQHRYHQPLSSSPAAWHNRCTDRPTTKYRKWPAHSVAVAIPSAAAAATTTTIADQQVSFSSSLSVCLSRFLFCFVPKSGSIFNDFVFVFVPY